MSFERELRQMLAAGDELPRPDEPVFDEPDDRTPFRGQPGASSLYDLNQNLAFSSPKQEAERPDLDAIRAEAADVAEEVIADLTPQEADFEEEPTAAEVDASVLNKAAEYAGPRDREQQFPALLPKQELPSDVDEWDEPEFEAEYQPVVPVEVEQTETPRPFDESQEWGPSPSPMSPADIAAQIDALE